MLFWARERQTVAKGWGDGVVLGKRDKQWPATRATVFREGKAGGSNCVVLCERDRQTDAGRERGGRW